MSSDLYLHITCGLHGGAAPLLARIALCLGGHSTAYPVGLAEATAVARTMDQRANCLNSLFLADLLRSCLMGDRPKWRPEQIAALARIASLKPSAKIAHLFATESSRAAEKSFPTHDA